ncbi:glycosyltransferase family 4 protein [Thermoleptolyngbya sp. C42_A2020_037]|uniref:glycosyltransferase family 4 protein n=1 Tax=Thermoleptolyngbya sp. C42_A2020_037 TaxID=2747799 RepID=UPI0019F17144|nr:glycosyltransferase family 4 protein [Thermoleptolyngbya sp. C42_A2020_037]MBF2084380.1 glycosyltransferase family 4 protein [Thermoleptolyngbya sp. C42_A2020_037]
MSADRLRVLLLIEQCNPDLPSVPNVGYQYFRTICERVDATLITHERNRESLERVAPDQKIFYISESRLMRRYYHLVDRLTVINGRVNWPLHNALAYLLYEEFNHRVYRLFHTDVRRGKYDLVHAITPMMPRYPVKLAQACGQTPFILGPVNGGVPFPKGFGAIARREFSYFNFLRGLGLLLPGYRATYQKADRILAGSSYTFGMLQKRFQLGDRLRLFYENGIPTEFFRPGAKQEQGDRINLLFVGRLVPYKGADILLEALAEIKPLALSKTRLTIVGDGAEREYLEALTRQLDLQDIVEFAGWVPHSETHRYYSQADLFCFPSIREFGGAVVLEAMAAGLPCIVADNGGIAEYMTPNTGFTIPLHSREYLVSTLAEKIQLLVEDEALRSHLSQGAIAHARQFEWEHKAEQIVALYHEVLAERRVFSPAEALI